ncbi:MAG: hypothetical protein WDM77_15235 [Steroidobacteraceae bacterium]
MTVFGRSKLPDVGTTIFTVMSRRARELGALNLGQGFPDYDIDPRLGELLAQAVREGPQPVRSDGRHSGTAPGDRQQGAQPRMAFGRTGSPR